MKMFEQALSMWSPFTGMPGAKRADGGKGEKVVEAKPSDPNEINELKAQLANMQQKIDKLSQDRD